MFVSNISVMQTQEREAKDQMKKRAKELQRQRQEAERSGRSTSGFGGGGFGSSSYNRGDSTSIIDTIPVEPTKPTYTAPRYISLPFNYYVTDNYLQFSCLFCQINVCFYSLT